MDLWMLFATIAVGCIILELVLTDGTSLMIAIGVLGATVSAAFGAEHWVNVLVFTLISLPLLLFGRKPYRQLVQGKAAGFEFSHESLAGKSGVVREEGIVEVNETGEKWACRSSDETELPVGSKVIIEKISGATLIVKTL